MNACHGVENESQIVELSGATLTCLRMAALLDLRGGICIAAAQLLVCLHPTTPFESAHHHTLHAVHRLLSP